MSRKGCGGWASVRVRKHRERLFAEQDGRCFHCQREMNRNYDKPNQLTCTADHLVPLADGGRNNRSNLVAACGRCNWGRSSSTEASKTNNRLQRLNLLNPQPIRNPSVAHALIETFGMDHLRKLLRAARDRDQDPAETPERQAASARGLSPALALPPSPALKDTE